MQQWQDRPTTTKRCRALIPFPTSLFPFCRSSCRSPRPGDQYSPRLGGDEDDPNGGYSSASYSPRPRRSMSDPWADPHDQYPRSSSQPRTVSRDDHPLLSAISRDGSSGDAHDGGARLIHPAAAADSDDPGDAGVKRDRGEGTGSLGSGGGVAGLGGQGHPWSTQAAQSLLSSSQSPAFSSRSPDDGSIGGQSGGGRSSPPMGDMVWDNEFRRGDGAGGVGRGSLDGAAESFQHHHGGDSSSRGRDRDRDTRAERGMGTLSSGQRPRSLHHLDRRQFAEAERRHFPAEAEQVNHGHISVCIVSFPPLFCSCAAVLDGLLRLVRMVACCVPASLF